MKILICGTRSKMEDYKELVWKILNENIYYEDIIIEGCCQNSADQYAEEWQGGQKEVKGCNVKCTKIKHFPATSGNYLKRNIEMIKEADKVFAFWDGFSYGTAHTIAHAVRKGIPVTIIDLKES